MTEPELISPLLDGFAVGSPMCEHDGVSCCPAIKENSEEKYIVKIISVPASQARMDALLLAGAYKDPAGAMDYFKEVADDVERELFGQAGFLAETSEVLLHEEVNYHEAAHPCTYRFVKGMGTIDILHNENPLPEVLIL